MEKIIKYIVEGKINIGLYDTICEMERGRQERKEKRGDSLTELEQNLTRSDMVENQVSDFLDYLDINAENLKQYKEENNDFWNDKLKDDRYFCDVANEWADSQIEIYNYTLWQESPILSEYIEEALQEFGFDKDRGLIGVFQMGQYQFYTQIANEVLEGLREYVENEL